MNEINQKYIDEIRLQISHFEKKNISLNKFIWNMEAIIANYKVSNVALSNAVSALEDINAYLLDGGQEIDVCNEKIKAFMLEIKGSI